jgi:hypothetical protein
LGSNITSLPEVIGWEDAMFNPHDVQDIRRVMEKALTDEAFYRELKAHALTQSAKFSWANTAHLAIDGFLVCCSRPKRHMLQAEGVTASRIQTMQKIDALSEVDRLGLAGRCAQWL